MNPRRSEPSCVGLGPHARAPLTGLTLVELLVTVALVALAAGTAVATCAGGLRVWKRTQTHGLQGQWLQLASERLWRDLHNLRRFKPIPYEGTYDTLAFPTLIATTTPAGEPSAELGQMGYFLDEARQTLCRAQYPYRRLRASRLRDTCQPVLAGVTRLRFSYYAVNPENHTPEWLGDWSSTEPPLAIKVELRYREESTREPVTQTWMVRLPLTAGTQEDASHT